MRGAPVMSLWFPCAFVFACSAPSRPMQNAAGGYVGPAGGGGAPSSISDASALADGASANSSDGGAPGNNSGPQKPPICDDTNTWSSSADVPSIALKPSDQFSAMTPDELTAVWSTASGDVYIADRDSSDAPFDTPNVLTPSISGFASGRIGLGPTGNSLVGAAKDNKSLIAFRRSGKHTAFTEDPTLAFAEINAMLVESGGEISEPVFSGDKTSFFYIVRVASQSPSLYESKWDGSIGEWARGVPFANPELVNADPGRIRRPTGVSSDSLTLFFFDEVAQTERGAWRDDASGTFTTFIDLPGLNEAVPNARCIRLYYANSGSVFRGQ